MLFLLKLGIAGAALPARLNRVLVAGKQMETAGPLLLKISQTVVIAQSVNHSPHVPIGHECRVTIKVLLNIIETEQNGQFTPYMSSTAEAVQACTAHDYNLGLKSLD